MEALLENKMVLYGVPSAIFLLILILKTVVIVPEGSVAVIARFGRYKRDLGSGIGFKIPLLERVDDKISLKETVVKFPVKTTITKDKVPVKPEMLAYFKVVTPHLYAYKIDDSSEFLEEMLESVLRDTINSMTVEETVASREVIKKRLLESLRDSSAEWGILFTRIDIKDIDLPTQIKVTLEEKAKEELIMRAEIAKAEAEKAATIIKAEGEAEAIKIVRKAHTERREETEEMVHVPKVEHTDRVEKEESDNEYDYEDDFIDDFEYR